MTRKRRALSAWSLVVLLTASGCAGSNGEVNSAVPSPPGTASPETSPSPSPSSEPASPTVGMPVLTIDGLGDVRLDQPIVDAAGAQPAVEWANAYCEGYGAWVQAGTSSTYGRADFTIDDTSDSSMNDRVMSVVVFRGFSTDTGISVGSTEAEVVAAYPSASLMANTNPYKSYQISDGGRLQFFLSNGVVEMMAAISAELDPSLNVGPTDWYFPCV